MPFWEAVVSGVVPVSVVALLKSAPFSINSVSRLATSMCPFSEANRGGPASDDARPHKFLSLPVCEKKNGSAVGVVDVMELILGCGGGRSIFSTAMDIGADDESDAASQALDGQHQQEQQEEPRTVPSKKAVAAAAAAVAAPAVEKGELGRRSSWV